MTLEDLIENAANSATNVLKIHEVAIVYKESAYFKGIDINGEFDLENYAIIVNSDWVKTAIIEEIMVFIFQQVRYAYQHIVVLLPHLVTHDLDDEVLETWKYEITHFIKPDGIKNEGYLSQSIIKDAINFSQAYTKTILIDLNLWPFKDEAYSLSVF